jgi:8-oxo-dGTP pyrophosphatase MutT (NUDIX family)
VSIAPDLPAADLRRQLQSYREEHAASADVAGRMLALSSHPGAFSREHLDPGHFTASAFVVCPERRRVLLIHHAKLHRWLQPGGHIELGDRSVMAAAQREVAEETGVSGLVPLVDGVFDIDIHAIPARPKEGPHQHFDVRYAFAASSAVLVASDEVRGARWVDFARVPELTLEDSVVRCVKRLMQRFG